MLFSVISIFPEIFSSLTQYGISGRSFDKEICRINLVNPRDFSYNVHQKIDDKSFGGGPGMVMMVEPLELSLKSAQSFHQLNGNAKPIKICLSPQGKVVNQNMINALAKEQGIIFVCGRYEGIDERFIQRNIDLELSIADIVVSGGELPAMLIMDSIIRQLPQSMNDSESAKNDSFMHGLLDHPHYTTPRQYSGVNVPDVLLSGNHKQIELWRLQERLRLTYLKRPDLLEQRNLTKLESRLLDEIITSRNKMKEI
ncbi:MAG: tRNA (guanosine(37)-N1)-methyltransferase TrmD [Burkholderiales bacterium]|jgi:tRNA (guanine37-N1)-methyltransferase|nr:tRNA (guanosine(37)-N1)-methyltransferase TrmD [Burkholderiales bacterium]